MRQLTSRPETEPRFLVDLNVGRLAKWLRALGYDSLFIPDADDEDLMRIAEEQARIVLTKDRYILERRTVTSGRVKVLLVNSDDFREQLRQIFETLGLSDKRVFSLCIECNEPLEIIEKPDVKDRVPPFVYETQDHFYQCPRCTKLYWRGTHWRNMRDEMAGFMEGAR